MEEKKVEVKQVSEREIWVGENRIYFGEDNILYETLIGKHDLETVIAIQDATDILKTLARGKINILVDLNKTVQPTSQARKAGKEKLENKEYGKIALFGMHPVARVIASFLMGVTKKEDMRFFKTKDDALSWLKE